MKQVAKNGGNQKLMILMSPEHIMEYNSNSHSSGTLEWLER